MKLLYVSLLLPLLTACELMTEPEVPDLLQTPPDQAGAVVITGRVVYSAVGIQAANVRVLDAGASVGTDETGRYRIVLPARFRGRAVPVQVRAIGFKPQTKTVMVTSDRMTVDFATDADTLRLTCDLGVGGGVQAYTGKRG